MEKMTESNVLIKKDLLSTETVYHLMNKKNI